jgi:hypothetical protein
MCNKKLIKHNLSFQKYEIDLILAGLKELKYKEHSNCKWEMQPSGNYYYTPNRKVKQIEFIERSIGRQLENIATPTLTDNVNPTPQIVMIEQHVCQGCGFLTTQMIGSEEYPEYDYYCTHKNALPHPIKAIEYKLIRRSNWEYCRTPRWCPFKKKIG